MKDNDDKVDQLENCNAFLAGILVDSPAAHESGGEVPDASTDKDSISSNDTDDDPKEKKHSNVMEPVAGWLRDLISYAVESLRDCDVILNVAKLQSLRLKCIPLKYRSFADNEGGKYEKVVKVLVINANSGPDLLFPKFPFVWISKNMQGGWENDETVEEAAREALEEAGVRGDLLELPFVKVSKNGSALINLSSAPFCFLWQSYFFFFLRHAI
ncbi:bZIP transcription factor family protein [Salix suchowensis]|nr:bZIP transcription factor family protein [Salix suchowensis]